MRIRSLKRSTGKWELPQPLDEKEDNVWIKIPRIARTVPFGYKISEDNNKVLDPVPEELEALEEAKKFIKRYSYREVSNWLSAKTGRYISHIGLMKRIKNGNKRKRQAAIYRRWAENAREAIAIAEALSNQRIDAKEEANNCR
jgi:hypothetical protein